MKLNKDKRSEAIHQANSHPMTSPFQNHIALVTGANDPEGLGFGIARELIEEGATVYFGCRLEAQGEAPAEPLAPFGPLAPAGQLNVC